MVILPEGGFESQNWFESPCADSISGSLAQVVHLLEPRAYLAPCCLIRAPQRNPSRSPGQNLPPHAPSHGIFCSSRNQRPPSTLAPLIPIAPTRPATDSSQNPLTLHWDSLRFQPFSTSLNISHLFFLVRGYRPCSFASTYATG